MPHGPAGHVGTIYVLHFDPPYQHAMHYIGWTTDLDGRLAEHLAGRGSPLVQAAVEAGCAIRLAHTRPGTRDDERALKRLGNACRICPECSPAWRARTNAQARARSKRAA